MKAGFGGTPSGTDPLVLDLDGDGLELTRADGDNVYFDIDNDDFAERTGWVGGDDGLLARDLNGNGTIDDISELFGNADDAGLRRARGARLQRRRKDQRRRQRVRHACASGATSTATA